MKKYIVEFIGTFFLVMSIYMAVGGGARSFAPIVIGCTLVALVYTGGHISGAHYNPAVTLGIRIRGKFETTDILPHIIAQPAGDILASFVGVYLIQNIEGAPGISSGGVFEYVPGRLAEFLGTFALVFCNPKRGYCQIHTMK